jgi:murein DD-endopeptidase MepM/ murein hydrolase activator NlpD
VAAKNMTIVFVPGGHLKVRQIGIPRTLMAFLILFFISAVLLLAWGGRDYWTVKKKMPMLSQLQKENTLQREQLILLTEKIDLISNKLAELKNFDQKLKTMVNLETNEDNNQFFGIGGSDPALMDPDYTLEDAHQKLVRLMHKSMDDLDREISVATAEKAELVDYFEKQKSLLSHTPSLWPTKGWISSRFGYRVSPFTNEKEFHKGLDISTSKSSSIIAPAEGIVTSVRWDHGYGKIVSINHEYGLITKYAHLEKVLVKKGEYVKRGQKIALVGDTGRTTGPHLHYEVHLNGAPVNPLRYILD